MLQLRGQVNSPYSSLALWNSVAFATVYSWGKETEQLQMRFSRQGAAALTPSASTLKTETTVLVPNIVYRISKADRIGPREYCMIYRGPGFLTGVWFGSSDTLSRQQVVLSLFLSLPVCRRLSLLTGEGGWGGRGAKSYGDEKAWSAINNSILSLGSPIPLKQLSVVGRVSQRDVVYLGWPIAPSYMSPNAGEGGWRGLSQWVQLCT